MTLELFEDIHNYEKWLTSYRSIIYLELNTIASNLYQIQSIAELWILSRFTESSQINTVAFYIQQSDVLHAAKNGSERTSDTFWTKKRSPPAHSRHIHLHINLLDFMIFKWLHQSIILKQIVTLWKFLPKAVLGRSEMKRFRLSHALMFSENLFLARVVWKHSSETQYHLYKSKSQRLVLSRRSKIFGLLIRITFTFPVDEQQISLIGWTQCPWKIIDSRRT